MSDQGDRPGNNQLKYTDAHTDSLSRGNLMLAYERCPIKVICIDPAGVITFANQIFLSRLKLKENEVLGQSFFELFEDTADNKKNENCLVNGEEIVDKEFRVKFENDIKWVLVSSAIYLDSHENISTFLFIRDISKLKKKENLFFYLNQAATALAQTRDTATALKQIAQFIVPTFANWFTVDRIRENKLDLLLLKHDDPAKIEWAYNYRKNYPNDLNGNSGPALVVKTGKPGFVPVVTDQMIELAAPDPVQREEVRKIGMHSVIMAPMWHNERVTGLVNFISSSPDRHFDEIDLEFALNFASLISLALENTRLNEEAANELTLRTKSEEKFRFLLDAIPHKMWTSGPDGRATYYNKQWYDYVDIEGFENLKGRIWDFVHPEDRAKAMALWPSAFRRGDNMEMEHRIRRSDGTYRWHLSRFTAHGREKGQAMLWVGTSTDIHEQKVFEMELSAVNDQVIASNEELFAANEELESANEEQAATNEELIEIQERLQATIADLEASEYRFRFLLNAMPQQVWTATADGKVNYVNDVICNDFGLTLPEIVAQGWERFIHPDDLPKIAGKWQQALSAGTEYLTEFRLRFYDGSYRWHLTRALPLKDHNKVMLWVGTNTNIELQKANEEKKDEFISIASHELRTPLTNIKAFTQLLQRVKDPAKLEPFVKKSSEHVNRLERLINDLLDVTKINAGKMTYQMEDFNFGELIDETIESIRLMPLQHSIILENKAYVDYTGDYYRLEQVLNNLISNAVKYSARDSKIIITSEEKDDNIVVSVRDFGIGIAKENVDRLFERYFRVENDSRLYDGLGLGLFISSEIIHRHGGSIWIESELGKGSTFYFRLPIARS